MGNEPITVISTDQIDCLRYVKGDINVLHQRNSFSNDTEGVVNSSSQCELIKSRKIM